ncbi:replication initiator [Actinoplanes sp. DH11]|uniref:replication initiator n=1 Tax=Actinoplanes sp. DH11 TaxID=2857011 RepID=UPI001E57B5C1|nr:replication initiator [Actinoplanes sp. DH11]
MTTTQLTVPVWFRQSTDLRQQAIARAARDDYPAWLAHVRPAAACTRPVRLAGTLATVEATTGRILAERATADMPDGVIYKPCGNRRDAVCPACSERYKRDAYQVIRSGLVGGKGVPEQVAHHPAVFPTFTAPSFGEVHTRHVRRHTCTRRTDCDCRPEPCHGRRDLTVCPHGVKLACFARHDTTDRCLGSPLCLDCYDYRAQAVWNLYAGELWRRTTIAVNRHIRQLAKRRGVAEVPVFSPKTGKVRHVLPLRLSFGKAAEMQRRGVAHFHAIVRLDGFDPEQPDAVIPPPAELDAADLVDAIDHAARTVMFTSDPHPARPEGWPIAWGEQILTKVITIAGLGEVTDAQVAAYLAKYATKSTEVTGHASTRLTEQTIDLYADADGTHTERLIDACWRLGNFRTSPEPPAPLGPSSRGGPAPVRPFGELRTDPGCGGCTRYRTCPTCAAEQIAAADAARQEPAGPPASPYLKLRRWAHMLGFGGHFLTKSRRYSITFALLRDQRVAFRRTQTAGPEHTEPSGQPTTLVVNFLQFVGAGWRTPADAMLANTSAAMAREHQNAARHHLSTLAA